MRTRAWIAGLALTVPMTAVAQPAPTPAPAPAAQPAAQPGAEPGAERPAGTSAPPAAEPAAEAPKRTEKVCNDRRDDDGDGMIDCADHDCHADVACKVGSGPENTNARCSDWFDNDGDGFVDCDDSDCEGPGVTICKGTWQGPLDSGGGAAAGVPDEEMPELRGDMTVEDLIGKGSDKDGERNDEVCSDGVDNDNDGKIDCADFGCRFDPSVSVCRGNPGMRFSIVAGIEASYDFIKSQADTRFSRLQLRSFGPIPTIDNSFYLVSLRTERTPRMTFAMFQIPLGARGHSLNVNSGGGGLSSALIVSASKHLLLEPAFYLYSAFEQGNGAAAEVQGPLGDSGKLVYRAFAAAGSGRSTGNIGGRYFTYGNENFTYGLGGQIGLNIFGTVSRFDSPFLYTAVPLTWGLTLGGKWDQRAQERYPAVNINSVLRWKRVSLTAELYGKHQLDFGAEQVVPGLTHMAYNIQLGLLAVPKILLLAADFGEFQAGEMSDPPDTIETDLKKQVNERQWRLGAHWYFFRNVGVLSFVYRNREVAPTIGQTGTTREQEFIASTQYRF